MSDTEKLDTVLKYLSTINQPNSFREFYEIKSDLLSLGLKYDEFELWIIMDKLCYDNYVSTEKKYVIHTNTTNVSEFKETNRLEHRFYITYNGRLFIKKRLGGYKWKQRKEYFNSLFQILTTLLLTIGTVGLLFWEIYKTFFPCSH